MTIIQDIKYILLKTMIVTPIQWQMYSIKKQLRIGIIHCGVILIKVRVFIDIYPIDGLYRMKHRQQQKYLDINNFKLFIPWVFYQVLHSANRYVTLKGGFLQELKKVMFVYS